MIGVLVDGEFQGLAPADGTVLARIPVPAGSEVQQATAGAVTLVRVDATLTALDVASGGPLWSAPALGLPSAPDLADPAGPLPIPAADGFVLRDPATGAELGKHAGPGLPEGGLAAVVGEIVVHRLTDRVLGFR